MTAHKHAEIIKAKADNMELVVFCNNGGKWFEYGQRGDYYPFYEDAQYFLCHPKHTKECLHWLNRGDIEMKALDGFTYHCPYNRWSVLHIFMRENFDFRIKPRKEKRWIAIDKNGFPSNTTCETKEKMMDAVLNPDKWQFIEIEVEV